MFNRSASFFIERVYHSCTTQKILVMKGIIAFVLVGIVAFSCSKSDNVDSIVGEWKLVEAKSYFGGEKSIDYTDKNIIYHFKDDDRLVISGDENVGYESGEYDYLFGEDHLGAGTDPKILLVKIDNSKWTYKRSGDKMTLGKSYIDGHDLIFEKR